MSLESDDPAARPRRRTVALALGAGAAKGLAHIGAIEEIERQGFEIVAVAGSSMGALIGGVYAMGKLDVYRDWVCSLAKLDMLKLVDWTFSGGGLIKGERIIGTLRAMVGDTDIEELPIAYTAVATDIDREREIWLTRGSLFDAIRASIAIPTLFRPYMIGSHRLVDGALLNPLPVTPLIRESADYLIAISVDGTADRPAAPAQNASADEIEPPTPRTRIGEWFGRFRPGILEKQPQEPGALALLTQAMDLMQANLARLRLAAYQPDLLIELPRNIALSYEFYRAQELIELGRLRTREVLENWDPMG